MSGLGGVIFRMGDNYLGKGKSDSDIIVRISEGVARAREGAVRASLSFNV